MSTDAAGAGGSILTRKTGPLANWMWMALLLLVALVYSMWQRNRSAPVETEEPVTEPLPGDQTPPPVFILPQNPQPTVPVHVHLPGTPAPAPPVGTRPTPTRPPGFPAPPTRGGSTSYVPVKVVKYSDPPGKAGPAWNSTLWGIAKHHGYGSAGDNYRSIWNDPKNAQLRAKRGTPTKIQPGDTIYVRRK